MSLLLFLYGEQLRQTSFQGVAPCSLRRTAPLFLLRTKRDEENFMKRER